MHAGQFLISMPKLRDTVFGDAVIYLWAHNEDGAQGLVVNHPFDLTLGELMGQLQLSSGEASTGDLAGQVMAGGPVEPHQGFILHTDDVCVEGSEPAGTGTAGGAGLTISYSREMLELIAADRGPQRYLLALGYAGWGAGQLEQELAEAVWLTAPSSHDVLFETPFEERLARVARGIGIDWRLLASEGGLA